MTQLNSTLDIVLGFVTIVLVLSLIIQSVQNIIKRLLRMKSRQAEQSLQLLFDYTLTDNGTKYKALKYASPLLGAATKLLKRKKDKTTTEKVVSAVKEEVREIGRKSFWGSALLDSVTKKDLDRILKAIKVDPRVEQEVKSAIENKVEKIGDWYDTVMPGLAERYERGMKWMAVLLSALVVVLFNADAIRIYNYVASDSVVQQQLTNYASEREERAKQQGTSDEDLRKQLSADIEDAKKLVSDYRQFGLTPFNWTGSFKDLSTGWRTVLGWLVMTLLLSLGAPFWEDALESLFGLKNTLRRKSKEAETQ